MPALVIYPARAKLPAHTVRARRANQLKEKMTMALFIPGPAFADIRGSIGGTTFSRSRAGAIARNRTIPINPNTERQNEVRDDFALAAAAYAGLPQEKALLWNDYASNFSRLNALGQPYTPSGKQMAIEAGLNLRAVGQSPLTVVPSDFSEPTLDLSIMTVTITNTGGELAAFTTALAAVTNAQFVIFQTTMQQPSSRIDLRGSYRQTHVAADPNEALLTPYEDLWNAGDPVLLTPGNVIGLRMRAINTANGLSTAWYYADQVVPATA